MKGETKTIKKYEVERDNVTKKILENVLVPKSQNGGRNKGDEIKSEYSEQNYERRQRKRAKTIKQKCRNCFNTDNSILATLTFDEKKCISVGFNPKEIEQTHNMFNRFIKSIKRRYDNFCYVATFDKQENGNWHYHMMCNFPIIKTSGTTARMLEELWQCGRIDVSEILSQGHFNNSVKYLIKNMVNNDSDKHGKKAYLSSRNAKSNIVVSSARVADTKLYNEIKKEVNKYPLSQIYSVTHRTGFIHNSYGFDDIIIDFNGEHNVPPSGYTPVNMKITAYSSPVKLNDFFPPLKWACTKPNAPKKSTKLRKYKPPKKHTP